VGRTATDTQLLSAASERPLTGTKKGRPRRPFPSCPVPGTERVCYGQAPVTMSEPGPDFFHVSAPTTEWTQYVVAVAAWMTMFLIPAS
jgi:hypothetical protein